MLDVLLLLLGLAMLYLGSEGAVRGASSIAKRLHLRPVIIGLTVVAFGTSLPELVVSLFAATGGNPDVSVGMVVGSNVANIALILGIAAIIRPIKIDRMSATRDVPFLIAATVLFTSLAAFDGVLDRVDGIIMLATLGLYLTIQIRAALKSRRSARELGIEVSAGRPRRNAAFLLAGLALLAGGGAILESTIPSLASALGVPNVVIAVTMVALGTSLPELATSLVATLRNEHDILFGNVVGSNVFNLLLIVGLTAVILPLPVGRALLTGPFPWMIGVTIALIPLTWIGGRVGRREGALLVATYAAFITFSFLR